MKDLLTLENVTKQLVGKRFCSDINNPEVYVKVLGVNLESNGFRVTAVTSGGRIIGKGRRLFLKHYPHEISEGDHRD